MTTFHAILVLATFLCSLVAGLLFAFRVASCRASGAWTTPASYARFRPSIASSRTINRCSSWCGSVRCWRCSRPPYLAYGHSATADRLLIVVAALLYLLSVQLPTFTINVPLNNGMQKLDPGSMNETTRKRAREAFEPRWNRWNAIRAAGASLASIVLMLRLLNV